MSRNTSARYNRQAGAIRLRRTLLVGRRLFVALFSLVMLLNTMSIVTAHAASDDLVFSIGMLKQIDRDTITLSFEDGTTETYRLSPTTTFRTQNGDERKLADLEIGTMVTVVAAEQDNVALTVVDGGATGFHEAGPADIRGHEGTCAGCDSQPSGHPQT